eukprot:CAMPEP_0202826162 /NCGR_PEP_ID=MMETSP1389-20130828/13432_1 /ASSEMBLY_ACC=CAM_ASM_000865 /TAXON_ID=302021 /ORGANISM="Rhodomonas sp., Strain CCMP768" /LENGTH=51 /DNA_ID=CAMNT_0049499431 /DNA_START=59 /DNA_END=210 /DNA_ORIENTATION=+
MTNGNGLCETEAISNLRTSEKKERSLTSGSTGSRMGGSTLVWSVRGLPRRR